MLITIGPTQAIIDIYKKQLDTDVLSVKQRMMNGKHVFSIHHNDLSLYFRILFLYPEYTTERGKKSAAVGQVPLEFCQYVKTRDFLHGNSDVQRSLPVCTPA